MEQAGIGELGDFEVGGATLARAKKLTWATELEVDFGQSEAIASLFHGAEAFRCDLAVAVTHEDAVAFVLATTHPTTELVELGQPKAVGAFDHHGGGVGDVDAHFDDGGRHQNIVFVIAKSQHYRVFVFGTHLAVNQGHP